jgi:hypothetical protein
MKRQGGTVRHGWRLDTRLAACHRSIVAAAHAVNQGKLPKAVTPLAGDLYILREKSPAEDGGLHAQRPVVESAVRLRRTC